jgi:hypothetical protein
MSMPLFLLVAASITTPAPVVVPAHVQYCVTSNAILGSEYAKPATRNTVFDAISERIEQAGLAARALTIGVPFVDDVRRTPSPHATSSNDDEANATYVVRVCAVVPADSEAAFAVEGITHVAARSVYASLCYVSDLDECRRKVEAAVQGTLGANGTKPVLLRTRQALSSDASPQSLAAALSDSTIIVLREKDQSVTPGTAPAARPAVPADLAVVSGEPTS